MCRRNLRIGGPREPSPYGESWQTVHIKMYTSRKHQQYTSRIWVGILFFTYSFFFHSFIAPNLYYGYMKIGLHAKLIQFYKNFRSTHHFRYTKHFPIFFCNQKNSLSLISDSISLIYTVLNFCRKVVFEKRRRKLRNRSINWFSTFVANQRDITRKEWCSFSKYLFPIFRFPIQYLNHLI